MLFRFHMVTNWLWRLHNPLIPWLIKVFYGIPFGVVLPPSARLYPGAILNYQGLRTVIHNDAVIEDRVVISTGVTIGGRSGRPEAPVIHKGPLIESGNKVFGGYSSRGIRVGWRQRSRYPGRPVSCGDGWRYQQGWFVSTARKTFPTRPTIDGSSRQ